MEIPQNDQSSHPSDPLRAPENTSEQDHVARRRIPLHAAAAREDAAVDTLETSHLQAVAAAEPTPPDAEPTPPDAEPSPIDDYTISVQQVRDHLRSKGLTKSKDTIQRWCREGDLDCQKLGVLGRYFTTESSLFALEQKLLPDMIAESAGANAAVHSSLQLHPTRVDQDVQVHEDASADEHSGMPLREGADAAARGSMQSAEEPDTAASSGMPQAIEVAELRAEVSGLTKQLEQAQEMNQFLREEVVSSRGQRGDVVKIAEQMLGTLETIAIGGRLEKPKPNVQPETPDPVRYQAVSDEPHDV